MRKKIYRMLAILLAMFLFMLVYHYVGEDSLEEQIKFDVPNQLVFEDIGNLKDILSYRLKHKGEYIYQDYYYDTPDFAIFNSGYSYRFRVRDKGDGEMEYGIQFKKEYDVKNEKNFKRVEVDNVIPRQMGLKILAGQWSEAYSDSGNYKTISRLNEFLEKNKIDKRLLDPLIYAKQNRSRWILKENVVLFFEISMDECSFSLISDSRNKQVKFYQLEFENKFKGENISQSQNKIEDLIRFFTQNYPIKITRDSKYKRVMTELME